MRVADGRYKTSLLVLCIGVGCLCSRVSTRAAAAEDDPAASEFFEKEIRPLLATKCWSCHGPEKSKDNLRLDSRAAALTGGDLGPAIVPGNAAESLLVQAVHYDDTVKMPPKGKLADAEIKALEKWIDSGAVWPNSHVAATSTSSTFNLKERAAHWSFQPLGEFAPPLVHETTWPLTPIDNFILAELEKQSIAPATEADRGTLIRRLTFDLTGLPPTPEEVLAFLADTRPDAYERVVDRLLASPAFGERWARHWLDLVRFVETSGHEFDYDIPYAWRYRDYVIRAFNADVSYDQLVREHVAGDLIEPPRLDPATGRNESILAPAFSWFNDGTHSPVDVRDEQTRRIDNQIDVMGKSFLGLTVACARCHDHKFDPIAQRDYYAIAGFLKSSRYTLADLAADSTTHALADQLRANSRALAAALQLLPSSKESTTPQDVAVFTSFNDQEFKEWISSGIAFAQGPSSAGDAHIAPDGRVVAVPPGMAHSALADERLQGVLRSPTFTINKRYIHTLAAGRGGRVQVVVDGFEKVRDPIYGGLSRAIDHGDELRWVTQDVSMWQGHRAYLELIDGGMPDFSSGTVQVSQGEGFVAVDEIVFSDAPTPPRQNPAPLTVANAGDRSEAAKLWSERESLRSQLTPPILALSMADGTGEDEYLLLRGSTHSPGPVVPRRFLEVFGAGTPAVQSGSGRMELAQEFTGSARPLLARVAVNRIWQHLLGRGLVTTPDDFGHMGQPPSHPALLDWLAHSFIASGFSQKQLMRIIVCSRVYRMSSRQGERASQLDPENRLFHSARVRRLEAESIRDAILAVSGRLNRLPYGPSEAVHLTEFMEGRGRPSTGGALDGAGRRTIYQNLRRNFLPPFLLAFDLPTPSTTIGRRNVSNVPAQALALLNDPFVIDQARAWASNLLSHTTLTDAQRLDQAYMRAFARPPTESERARALEFLQSQADGNPVERWARLCHVLYNVKEFIFIP